MTKDIPWPEDPTELEKVKYFKALHECEEAHHAEQLEHVDGIGSRISLDWRVNILALAAIMLTLGGMAVGGVYWFSQVNQSLTTLTQVVADQKTQDALLAQDHTDLQVLKATSQENNTALLGPNSASNQRHRATGQ